MGKFTPMTEHEVMTVLESVPEDKKKATLCALTRHSRIVTTCFGYIYCARCEDQIGDTLMGASDLSDVVIVGHNCEACRKNAKSLTWEDTFLSPEPFPVAEETQP